MPKVTSFAYAGDEAENGVEAETEIGARHAESGVHDAGYLVEPLEFGNVAHRGRGGTRI
jgi:hypothetical protein